jgi:hypothetical protein
MLGLAFATNPEEDGLVNQALTSRLLGSPAAESSIRTLQRNSTSSNVMTDTLVVIISIVNIEQLFMLYRNQEDITVHFER